MQSHRLIYRNILIIKPGAIGDLLQMTPVIRALHASSPAAQITLVVGSGSSADIFRYNPHVADVLVYDRRRTNLGRLWAELRRRKFDLVLNFQRSNPRSWILASAAFPCRVLVYHKSHETGVHAVVNYAQTLRPLGIPLTDLRLELFLDKDSRTFAQDLWVEHGLDRGPVIAVNPGASHAVNRWPAEKYAELADLLWESASARTLIIGGPDDAPLAGSIVARSSARPVNIAGTTSLLQLGAILELCPVLVSGDTGPMHMAASVGTKVVAVFGAADPLRTGPVGVDHRVVRADEVSCVPCRSRTCKNPVYLECMDKISAARVFDTVRELAGVG